MNDRTAEQVRIAQITDRVSRISLGKWVAHTWDPMAGAHVVAELVGDTDRCCRGQHDLPKTNEDAEFIAGAPDDVFFLLATVHRLNAQMAELIQNKKQ